MELHLIVSETKDKANRCVMKAKKRVEEMQTDQCQQRAVEGVSFSSSPTPPFDLIHHFTIGFVYQPSPLIQAFQRSR